MNTLEERAKKARKQAGYNQTESGKLIGISRAAISQWENGETKSIKSTLLHKAAMVYGVDANWLATGAGSMIATTSYDNVVAASIEMGGMIPVISWVQAGSADEAFDLTQPGAADEYVNSIGGGNRVYGLHVRGNSMTAPEGVVPTFPEGYIIHVDPDQSTKPNDFIIAKIVGENKVTFKQLKQGDEPYLLPLNPDHRPIYDEFRVLGKVIGVSLKL